MSDYILTRDLSSGRIHKRYDDGDGGYTTHEGCNLDQAGAYEVITADELELAEPAALCRNDFPHLDEEDLIP